jgi:hypothetical protein
MPYSITTKDGITINNIPDNVQPDSPELKARVAQIRSSAPAQAPQETSMMQDIAAGATRGLALPAAGAALGAAVGAPLGGVGAIPGAIAGAGAATLAQLVGDPVVNAVNKLTGSTFATPTEAIEGLLTAAGMPKVQTEAGRIAQTTAAGAAGGGGIAAAGKAVQMAAASPVTRAVGGAIAAQPAAQVAGGAGAGLASQAAAESGAGTAGQLAAGLAGGLTGVAGALRAQRPQPTIQAKQQAQQAVQNVADLERQFGRVLTTDVVPPKTFLGKTVQAAGERIPYAGTAGMRQAQQEQRIEAVRSVLKDYNAYDYAQLSNDVLKDLATKRTADINKYSTMKKQVIDKYADQGTVTTTNATRVIDEQIADLAKRQTQGADEAIQELTKIKDNLQNRNLFELEAYRRDELANIFKEDPAKPLSQAARDVGEQALRKVYAPVNQDIGNFIKSKAALTGDRRDFDKWMVANKRLADTANDFKNTSLKNVLLKGNIKPEEIQRLLFAGKPSEVQAIFSKLTPQGKANARAAVLAKAADDAGTTLAEGGAFISPDKFANSVQKMGNSVGVIFTGDDLKRIDGLTRYINSTKRAAQAAVVPQTGVQAVPFIAGSFLTDILGGAGAATATALSVGGIARIYESAPVRNLLLQLSKTKANTPQEAALLQKLSATLPSIYSSTVQQQE